MDRVHVDKKHLFRLCFDEAIILSIITWNMDDPTKLSMIKVIVYNL